MTDAKAAPEPAPEQPTPPPNKHAEHARKALAKETHMSTTTGLESRYEVRKINDLDGKHADCRYFVLDPQHDPIARDALATYAAHAKARGYGELARDLSSWLGGLDHPDEVGRGVCGFCNEPGSNCPNGSGESCCLPCYDRGDTHPADSPSVAEDSEATS